MAALALRAAAGASRCAGCVRAPAAVLGGTRALHQEPAAAPAAPPSSAAAQPAAEPLAAAASGGGHGGYAHMHKPPPSFPPPDPALYSPVRAPDARRRELVDEMIRVDHAGEVGAVQIYAGQMWALRGTKEYDLIKVMKEGEEQHLATLSRMMQQRRVRPTALLPLWNAAGWALGAVSGVFGLQTAMAATVAIETAIGQHYNDQIRDLLREGYGDDERELMAVFKQHRDEEMAHLDTGVAHGAEGAPLYGPLSAAVKAGCALAIEVAKRV